MGTQSSFHSILSKFRKYSFSERDKGERFERLMQAYLKTDPKYSNLFKKVWLWSEFPCKNDLGGSDTGIDLVAYTINGEYWAIQCKCYQEDTIIDKPAVDSFLATSSREFKDENLKTTRFSYRLWISTTNKWGPNASEAIKNQLPPVSRLNLHDLEEAPVDWEKLEKGIFGELSRKAKKELRPHQILALEKANEHFKKFDRGKLIMACGTGKTFNSLRIAENETDGKGLILFLVPSISLLNQSLGEWSSDAKEPINAICICSDPEATRKKTKNIETDSFSIVDLALPASTNVKDILKQFRYYLGSGEKGLTVVFSTYQSIDVIAQAQKELIKNDGYGIFDLIICDEAHRTTGVTLADQDESSFVKVHNNDFIKGKKRLYMTATPRIYSDDSKSKAAKADAVLCSMDDLSIYGVEIYRIGFGESVDKDLLSDYKVLILTLNENDIPPALQASIADENSEINTDDISKLIGCVNALSKQILGDEGILKATDPDPMRRSVAFCQSIAISKKITNTFNTATAVYLSSLPAEKKEQMVTVSSKHIDGTMSAPVRDELLSWLKSENEESNDCRVLTNVRCLSEGVDVPSLDSVMFLSARNSQVDVVQSVGRVMRKSPGKKYGYIIIPVIVPSNIEADKALDDNERYKVVWTVLNALRAHDDRFNAIVNKIDLNKKRPGQILIGRPDVTFDNGVPVSSDSDSSRSSDFERQINIQFEELQAVVFARMVQKVGDRRYWEQWAKDVAQIAERYIVRITKLINEEGKHKQAFSIFLKGLQKNINPSISETEAIEMLSQHIITKPVFEALFEGYSFVKNNPISVSIQKMLDLLEAQAIEKDAETLQKFYESVKMRASGIDNAEGKQRIIIELYDKFFKTAFPKMVERLGIVYTPVEVVDFIIHSVNDVLKKEFDRSLSDENIHILDPFTGTGTFITRLLQSKLIKKEDLLRKYKHELHANEIVLLAYYIAAVNIENSFHDAIGESDYKAFDGICLTDTFQLGETDESQKLFSEMFPQNSERVARQKKAPLRVIIGNPPYSVGQKSKNDIAQNQKYEKLDSKISNTYVRQSLEIDPSSRSLKKFYYDPYIKAFRWSTDRLDPVNGGIIAFVSNGGWLESNSLNGFRKYLEKEFDSIYVFNLRGNAIGSGEYRKKEAGNVFKSGTKTPIAITLLVKKPNGNNKANIYYHDIGDYLSREEKLTIIIKFRSVINLSLKKIIPNEVGDWIRHRSNDFLELTELAPETKYDSKTQSFFSLNTNGVVSGRSSWVYNFSNILLTEKASSMINFLNNQIDNFRTELINDPKVNVEDFVAKDESKIKWDDKLFRKVRIGNKLKFEPNAIRLSFRTPFCKEYLYFDEDWNWSRVLLPKIFPTSLTKNLLISCIGKGASREFSVLISNTIIDYHFQQNGQCFPLYFFEERKKNSPSLFDSIGESEYIRIDGVSDFILERAKKQYGKNVSKEDIFYYVYGILHCPDYRNTFTNDLKKMLPRLPLVDDVRDFWKFSKSGSELADLHINYEKVPPYSGVTVGGAEVLSFLDTEPVYSNLYYVEKMRFPKKDQKDTIIYNSKITIENIPAKAYDYIVNGKSAIEWIMERYQVTINKDSGIKNDPNDWSKEVSNSRYILDLLLSIINVSVKTVEIVDSLPKLKFE